MKKKLVKKAELSIELPEDYTEASSSFDEHSLLIHGEKKIGKTTLANQGGRTLFLQFDPPQRAYRRMEVVCPDWRTFNAVLAKLERHCPYDRVCVDGAENWFKRCQKWACEKLAVEHPQEAPWGQGWDLLRSTFSEAVDRILRLPCGRWFLCHSAWREVETRKGRKIEKLLPVLSRAAEEILNGRVDGWFAYDYYEDQRIMIVRGDERTGAGHRLDSDDNPHFRTRKGEPIAEVPMGSSPEEAYRNLVAAYENKQAFSHISEANEAGQTKKPKFRVKKR